MQHPWQPLIPQGDRLAKCLEQPLSFPKVSDLISPPTSSRESPENKYGIKNVEPGAQVVEWLERMPHTQPTPVRIPIGGPLLHVTPPLSPMFPVYLLINKGVYANKILKKKKKKYKRAFTRLGAQPLITLK